MNPKTFIRKNKAKILLLVFISLAVYINTLSNRFVSDDIPAVPQNKTVSNFFRRPNLESPVNLLLSVNYLIGGLHPEIYHLTNIVIHTAVVLLSFFFLSQIASKKTAFFASAIFAVHPLNTEAVSWISGRPYPLYSLFFLLALLIYISQAKERHMHISTHILVTLSFVLAILSNPLAFAFPFILILYEICFGDLKKSWKRIAYYLILFAASAFFYRYKIAGRVEFVGGLAGDGSRSSVQDFFAPFISFWSYIWLFLFPKNLSFYHEDLSAAYHLRYFLTFAAAALLPVSLYLFKKSKLLFFALGFYAVSLGPTLTPIRIGWTVAERYAYFGTLGLSLIISHLILRVEAVIHNSNGILLPTLRRDQDDVVVWGDFSIVIFIILISIFSLRTIGRNFDWRNEDTLWIATVKASPASPKAHNNMGDYYSRHGDPESALKEFETAFKLRPDYADAYHNYGNTLMQIGKLDESVEFFEKALQFNPDLIESYNNLAVVYHKKGDQRLARQMLDNSLSINPRSPITYNLMGLIYFENEEYGKAREAFIKALEADTDYTPARENFLILENRKSELAN